MRTRETDVEPFVNLSELTEIELLIMRRMREFTIGEHRSLFTGSGFDFVGLRDWQPGDRTSNIDWAQSTLTNFSPMIVRDYEQRSTATVVAIADASLSTRCGIDGVPIAAAIARTIGTIGMSAVFFQDLFGLITFDAGFEQLQAIRPRVGKNQVIHTLEAYQFGTGLQPLKRSDSISMSLAGFMRKTTMVPVISDFLFDDADAFLRDLRQVNNVHDVFIMIVDASFAFELPKVSAGWVEVYDVETGRTRMMSRRELGKQSERVKAWQDEIARQAKDNDLDVIRLSLDQVKFDVALVEWVAERRLRRRK